ncbi:MAG: hypothetical protein RJA70_116, partial [Pseudomonadota bacterium]
ENDPFALFERLFAEVPVGGVDALPDPAVLRRRAERQSIIDGVTADLSRIQQRVGQTDRYKIEAHLERLRAVETRLQSPTGSLGASCTPPNHQTIVSTEGYQRNGELQIANLAHAFACDLTRVATLQWQNGASGYQFPRPGGGMTAGHHGLTHKVLTAEDEADLSTISRWYADRFQTFIETLKSIPEGNGTVLDNTLIVWTSEHNGAGNHGRTDLPFVLAGRCGGYFKPGRFLQYNKAPHADLYIAIAHAMGLTDITQFGTPGIARGPLANLS